MYARQYSKKAKSLVSIV